MCVCVCVCVSECVCVCVCLCVCVCVCERERVRERVYIYYDIEKMGASGFLEAWKSMLRSYHSHRGLFYYTQRSDFLKIE